MEDERVRAIIVEAGAIALIERKRPNRQYFVFPGGGCEEGETPREALVREVLEETGLLVSVGQDVARVVFPDHIQGFYLASVAGGEFGAGTGPEFTDPARSDRGTYRPIWLPVADVHRAPIYPEGVASLVIQAQEAGWPERPTILTDRSWTVQDSLAESRGE